MARAKAEVLDIDGKFREKPDFPVAVVEKVIEYDSDDEVSRGIEGDLVYPIFSTSVTRNLFGRIMTLVEATTDSYKLKSVKDIFAKELRDWEADVYDSARDISDKALNRPSRQYKVNNLYTRQD